MNEYLICYQYPKVLCVETIFPFCNRRSFFFFKKINKKPNNFPLQGAVCGDHLPVLQQKRPLLSGHPQKAGVGVPV